jgi:hypothetical protein
LDALQRMIREDEGPSQYFTFDGIESGLQLRPVAHWSRKHYSACVWVCVDRPPCNGDCIRAASFAPDAPPALQYKPHLFSLVAEDGTALEAYLLPVPSNDSGQMYALQLEHRRSKSSQKAVWLPAAAPSPNASPSSTSVSTADAPRLLEGRWHFVGISHRVAGFRSAAELTVVVNTAVYRGTLPFPALKSIVAKSRVAARADLRGQRREADEVRGPALHSTTQAYQPCHTFRLGNHAW